MTTGNTTLLGLALPVEGELDGTWGDAVNDQITSLLDSAVAGTTTLSTDADVTLTSTVLAANQARQAIILWNPASGTVTRNITAPARSKIYTVINASGGTQSIVFRGAGPTTGVTIIKGESAVVVWNGTDFIKASNTGGGGSFTNVTISGTTTLSGLTASTALALNASKEVISVTNTGAGNNVLATSPTLVTPALGTPASGVMTNVTGLPLNTGVTGALPIANGGTGETTRQSAMDILAGAVTAGSYLRGNGTDVVMSTIQAADVPTLNQNTTGTAANVTGTVAVANGGTGQTTYTDGQLLIGNTTGGTLAKATLSAGTGVSVTNGAGSITIANTAPDQTVALTGAGATTITGTYPNFTISSANTTYGVATSTVAGLVELASDTAQTVAANAVTDTASRSYGLQLNAAGQGVINVPWTDTVYTLPAATTTVLGGIELGSDTQQTVAANAVSATASRSYALQVNAAGQGVVNVPWTDNNSGGTVTSITGGTYLTGGTITTTGTLAVDATSANTGSKVVARDSSGNFSAGMITTVGRQENYGTTTDSGTIAGITGGTSGGTISAPTQTLSGTSLYRISPLGYTGLAWTGGARLEFVASEDITATNRGTNAVLSAIAAGGAGATSVIWNGSTLVANGTTLTGNTGTVTSVTGTGTVSGLTLGGTVTASGNLTLSGTLAVTPGNFSSQTANTVLAAPDGAAGTPSFRAIVAADIPTLNQSTTGTAANVTGTVAIANGGTGQTTRQEAMDALAGSVTAGSYLRGNGTDVVMSTIQAADVPTLNQNTTGTASNVTGTVAVANGGTGAVNSSGALTNLGAQATLVSGTNIKTVNGNSLLGSGNVVISGTPAGSTTQIQYNDAGAFGASSAFTFSAGNMTVSGVRVGPGGTSGVRGTALGSTALSSTNAGADNTAVGYEALEVLGTGAAGNTGVGSNTLTVATGNRNTAVGAYAMNLAGSAASNVAIGADALSAITSGSYNVALGVDAGQAVTTGSGNTIVSPVNSSGTYAPVFNPTTTSNRVCMGSTAVTNAYVQVAWTVVSDARDKTELAPVPHGLSFVLQLKPTAYRYKPSREATEGHGPMRYGFLAQDVLALEGQTPVIVDADDPEKLRFNDQGLIAVLVNAVQELKAEFDAYKASHP
jgi:hypothetical protein